MAKKYVIFVYPNWEDYLIVRKSWQMDTIFVKTADKSSVNMVFL